MKLHRTKVTTSPSRGKRLFPISLPDDATIECINEKAGGSPVYVYYSVPEDDG